MRQTVKLCMTVQRLLTALQKPSGFSSSATGAALRGYEGSAVRSKQSSDSNPVPFKLLPSSKASVF